MSWSKCDSLISLLHAYRHVVVPQGISLSPENYDVLMKSVARDCKVLESFGIMDFSLLLGVHNLDQAMRERLEVHVGGVK